MIVMEDEKRRIMIESRCSTYPSEYHGIKKTQRSCAQVERIRFISKKTY